MADSARRDFFGKLALFGSLFALGGSTSAKAQAQRKRFVKAERPEQSGYSLAVVTEGAGKTIWLAACRSCTTTWVIPVSRSHSSEIVSPSASRVSSSTNIMNSSKSYAQFTAFRPDRCKFLQVP